MATPQQTPVAAVQLGYRFREDAFAVVHRGVSPDDDPWRISWFDALGAVGHTGRATPEEALEDAVADGYVHVQEVGYFPDAPPVVVVRVADDTQEAT